MLLRDLCADFNKLPHGRGECGEISVLCGLVKAGLGHFVKRLPGIEKAGRVKFYPVCQERIEKGRLILK